MRYTDVELHNIQDKINAANNYIEKKHNISNYVKLVKNNDVFPVDFHGSKYTEKNLDEYLSNNNITVIKTEFKITPINIKEIYVLDVLNNFTYRKNNIKKGYKLAVIFKKKCLTKEEAQNESNKIFRAKNIGTIYTLSEYKAIKKEDDKIKIITNV